MSYRYERRYMASHPVIKAYKAAYTRANLAPQAAYSSAIQPRPARHGGALVPKERAGGPAQLHRINPQSRQGTRTAARLETGDWSRLVSGGPL